MKTQKRKKDKKRKENRQDLPIPPLIPLGGGIVHWLEVFGIQFPCNVLGYLGFFSSGMHQHLVPVPSTLSFALVCKSSGGPNVLYHVWTANFM